MFQINKTQADKEAVVNSVIDTLVDEGYTELEARLGMILTVAISGPMVSILFDLPPEEVVSTVRGSIELTLNAEISDFCPYLAGENR